MNPYLTKLRTKGREKACSQAPSKLSKPSFEGFDGDGSRWFSDNEWPTNTVERTPLVPISGCSNPTRAR
jgi:hypothetical protein